MTSDADLSRGVLWWNKVLAHTFPPLGQGVNRQGRLTDLYDCTGIYYKWNVISLKYRVVAVAEEQVTSNRCHLFAPSSVVFHFPR